MTGALQQAERDFLEQYLEWLIIVEEGLRSVTSFYHDNLTENGDRLLKQMMDGFTPFSPENMTMQQVFGREEETTAVMEKFYEKVLQAAKMAEHEEGSRQERMQMVAGELLPIFQRWKLLVDSRRNRE
ncbi:hypothetical protein [Alteribacillus sp. HJP-4]|uniref:hypothetical protein n=1 Tax=Alteribacillus sp. HJP-4 TaxID=2775394 RepID=UPI0035CCD109